jgi:asparagine synthase (glutamine-hydrolysing)
MAGWLTAWNADGRPLDPARWDRCIAIAGRFGDVMAQAQVGPSRVAAWRRRTGEFPRSGTISSAEPRVAWVGQCLDDRGDATDAAIRSVSSPDATDAELAALNGPFAGAILGTRGIRLMTDRYRHYPIYWMRAGPLCVAGTDLRAVSAWLASPAPDRAAFAMLLRTGELIDRMTLLEGVELLPPATLVEDPLDGRGPRERRYWALRHTPDRATTFPEHRDRLVEVLRASVRRIARATPRPGLTLSGGLDSRLILGICPDPSGIPSFTWGQPGCRDIACAAAFARRVGSPHTVRHWDPPAFPPLWSLGSDLTAGSFGVESMYMLPFTGLLAGRCDVVLNGLAGDAIMGGNFLKLSWVRQRSLPQLAAESWRWRVSPAQDAAAGRLLAGPDDSRDRWIASIAASPAGRPVERLNDWLYENRVFRNTNSGTMLLRHAVESHAPFFDNQALDALLAVPMEMKLKHRLYLAVLKRASPAAAAVPWQRTGIPPAWGFLASGAAMAFQRYTKAALKRVGIHAFRSISVADPAAWFRGPWREPARAIILGQPQCSRGLIDPDAARTIFDEHQHGADHTRHLGVLIAVELFLRQVIAPPALEQTAAIPAGAAAS